MRLTDDPAMHLLAVIDEVLPEQMLDEHVQDGHVQEMPQSEPAEQEPQLLLRMRSADRRRTATRAGDPAETMPNL